MSREDQQDIIRPAAAIPTPPPLPETLTAEQRKARRKAAEERYRAEQEQREEAEKKAIEERAILKRKNSMGPVIEDSFREAMARRNAQIEGDDNGDDWDEEDDAMVSTSPIVATVAAISAPTAPQKQIETPEVSVKSDDRLALLQAIRNGVKLKKPDTSKEQSKIAAAVAPSDEPVRPALTEVVKARPQLPVNLLADLAKDNKAGLKPVEVESPATEATASTLPKVDAPIPATVKKSDSLDALQQNVRFKKAKEDADNQVIKPIAPVVAAASTEPGKDEWNQGFNRIRQRNIPFQYVPEADLKKGIDAFNQKKAAKEVSPSVAKTIESAPKPVVVFEPKMTITPKPVPAVDTDRDYALALHLDELQRSPNASDRQLADDPEYIRRLQEAYDNDNEMDTKACNQLSSHAHKEVQHQNLEKEPEVKQVTKPSPAIQQGRRSEAQYVAQSLTLMVLVAYQSFKLNGASSNLFMSYACICLSCRESLSINENGKVSYNRSQALSYTQTSISLSGNSNSVLSSAATNLAMSYNNQVSLSACPKLAFFGKGAAIQASIQAPRIDMDRVSPIGLPAIAAV